MRTPVLIAVLTAALLVPAAAATAASGSSPSKAGLSTSSGNGGDNGWGNCGNNSSAPLAGEQPGHNGGFKKGDVCVKTDVTPPVTVVDPTVTPTDGGTVVVNDGTGGAS